MTSPSLLTHFSGRRVAVTGAGGFIGSHVALWLKQAGARLILPVRHGSAVAVGLQFPGAEVPVVDLRSAAQVESALRDVEIIFHVAGDYRFWALDPSEIYQNNIEGTRNVLLAAWKFGVERVVCTGTPGIFAPRPDGTPADESAIIAQRDCTGPYKESKWLAFHVADSFAKLGLPLVHAFPTAPIGVGDHRPTPTGRILLEFLNGNMPMLARTGLNFVDVRASALGHLQAATHGNPNACYLLGGENLWLREFLKKAGEMTGRAVPAWDCPHWVSLAAAWCAERMAECRGNEEPFATLESVRMSKSPHFFTSARAEKEIGYESSPIDSAIRAAVEELIGKGKISLPNGLSRPDNLPELAAPAGALNR